MGTWGASPFESDSASESLGVACARLPSDADEQVDELVQIHQLGAVAIFERAHFTSGRSCR